MVFSRSLFIAPPKKSRPAPLGAASDRALHSMSLFTELRAIFYHGAIKIELLRSQLPEDSLVLDQPVGLNCSIAEQTARRWLVEKEQHRENRGWYSWSVHGVVGERGVPGVIFALFATRPGIWGAVTRLLLRLWPISGTDNKNSEPQKGFAEKRNGRKNAYTSDSSNSPTK